MKSERIQGEKPPSAGKWLVGGGLATAFAAALCCIGPLVAAGLGLGAFAAAGFFSQMRPLFLGVAVLLVAGAWIWDWRRRQSASRESGRPGADCETGCGRRSRAGLALFTAAALLLGASPYLLEAWGSRSNGGGDALAADNSEAEGLATWRADLEGLHCPSCAPGLKQALLDAEGVEQAEVSYRPQKAVVYYEPASGGPERFREIVKEFGYGVASERGATATTP